jgi:hypothetical protein
MQGQLKYQPIWAFLYLFFGIVFGALFLGSAYYLNDSAIYLNTFAAGILVFIGYTMRTKPNVIYTKEEIIVFGLFGNERYRYDLKGTPILRLKNERFYLGGEKLKFNRWFIDKKDWERIKHFYFQEKALLDELQD